MKRRYLLLAACAALAGCAAPPPAPTLGPDGKPLPRVYRLSRAQLPALQFRMRDAINTLREEEGVVALQLNAKLNAAAATHSRDMSVQNRPWHFGSDGSSPLERVRRVGYEGELRGENISETFETELQTLAAWMEEPATRAVILDPEAREMGFAFHQDGNGKLWWTLVTGAPKKKAPGDKAAGS